MVVPLVEGDSPRPASPFGMMGLVTGGRRGGEACSGSAGPRYPLQVRTGAPRHAAEEQTTSSMRSRHGGLPAGCRVVGSLAPPLSVSSNTVPTVPRAASAAERTPPLTVSAALPATSAALSITPYGKQAGRRERA